MREYRLLSCCLFDVFNESMCPLEWHDFMLCVTKHMHIISDNKKKKKSSYACAHIHKQVWCAKKPNRMSFGWRFIKALRCSTVVVSDLYGHSLLLVLDDTRTQLRRSIIMQEYTTKSSEET